MTLLDPDSADRTLLQDRQVAVLGFDALAAAHALNLRDSGVDVWVGADPDGAAAARAEMEGLAVSPPEDAVQRCDIVLVPSAVMGAGNPADLGGLLAGRTEPGDMVIVTTGRAATGALTVPDGVDLAMLRTVADGDRVREEYLDGRGSPALVAVARDASGAAWATLTAYAAAMGSLRSGAIVTTVEHEARAMAFGEEHVHRPLLRTLEDAFEELVDDGVETEVAYLAVVHELKSLVDRLYAGGGPHAGAGPGQAASSALEEAGVQVRARLSWMR